MTATRMTTGCAVCAIMCACVCVSVCEVEVRTTKSKRSNHTRFNIIRVRCDVRASRVLAHVVRGDVYNMHCKTYSIQ